MNQTPSPPPLIRSKLYPPRLTSHHIPRDHLVDQLTTGSQGALALISAPAGSGKSTLLSEWLASTGTPYGWISLDELDNERDVFLGYVLAAARDAFPAMAQETRDLLDANIPPPLTTIARSLSNDLDQLAADFLLILDDYHVVTNPHIHELLGLLLRHPPARLHLVVATRLDPPWPLATLRARGQLTELRFPDLQFTAAESAALLQNALGASLHHEHVAALHDECEGWAAGLHLMTLVLDGREDGPSSLARAAPADTDITEIGAYLLAEVLSKQTPPDQDRLLQMSILGRFSVSLCEAVCSPGSDQQAPDSGSSAWGKAFLARLVQENLFIIRLDSRHEYYRFHHLFQQFLAAKLTERYSIEEIAALHRRASAWFAERGFIEEALAHALKAGDTLRAARLVAHHRHALYNHEQFARLARWLRLLPADVKEHTPELLLAEARVAIMNWRYTEADVFLDRAERELARRPPTDPALNPLLGELAILRGNLQFWDGDAKRFLAGSRFALATLPVDASHLRGMAHTGVAAGQYLLGDSEGAWAYLDQQLASQSPRLPVYAWLLQSQGFLCWLDGNLTKQHDVALRLANVSEILELPDHEAMAHYFLGVVHYARNELEAAEAHLRRAFAARFTMRLLWWCQAAGVLALTLQALGRSDEARATLADAHGFLLKQHALRILPNLGAFEAEINRLQHRLVEANSWAAAVSPLPLTWSLAVVDPRFVQARVFLLQDRAASLDLAAQILAELQDYCAQVPNRRLKMEVDTLEALLQVRLGHDEDGMKLLERAVLTAETEGWVRLFVDLGPGMEDLLTRLVARGVAPHYLAHVLSAFPAAPDTSAPPRHDAQAQLIDPLTDRELDVLTLLAQRYSNKEIAARLFISPATVKHHTLSIYRKLDVTDRRQAVALADELGLLSLHP